MIRVVLDTNIIVSALLQPLGPPAQVFVLVLGDSVLLCVSRAIYADYEEVISRPRLQRSEAVITATALMRSGSLIRPKRRGELRWLRPAQAWPPKHAAK